MPKFIRHSIAVSSALILSACGGTSPESNETLSVAVPPIAVGNPMQTVCGMDRTAEHFCDQLIQSPAPPTTGTNVANPGVNGVEDCEADWDTAAGETDIALTVFIPPHGEFEKLPLILQSHGWGGGRVSDASATDPAADANTFGGIEQFVQQIWREDYIVISFDQRGWGGSTGEAQVIDPCYETVDAMAVVDWALENLPVDTSDGDVVLGSIGGSYGGAYQMMLAAMDDRLDAIVPVATWSALADDANPLLGSPTTVDASTMHSSLITNEVVKKGYVQGLCLLANTATRDSGAPGGATRDLRINQACTAIQSGAKAGKDLDTSAAGGESLRELFASNGMSNPNLRIGRDPMSVDVLLFQGMRDMVFDGVEAYDNYLFFSDTDNNAASADVRLITTDGGHMLTTFAQAMAAYPQSPPDYQVQGDNDCGDINMFDSMVSWFNEKLKGEAATVAIPEVCIALDSDTGVELPSVPVGNTAGAYSLAATSVSSTTATNMDIIGSPRLFVPLATMTEAGYIAGIPIFDSLRIDAIDPVAGTVIASGADATAFVAIGIQKAADNSLLEVDEQVAGIRRSNDGPDPAITYNNLRLPMIGDSLAVGDQVGLLLYRSNGYYQLSPGTEGGNEYSTNAYEIRGSIQIPLFNSAGTAILPAL